MFTSTPPDAAAPTASSAKNPVAKTANAADWEPPNLPRGGEPNQVRHMLFGNIATVRATIRLLHKLDYAEPNDWSKPISTGRGNEVMSILTKRIGA